MKRDLRAPVASKFSSIRMVSAGSGWRLFAFITILIIVQYPLDKTVVHWFTTNHFLSPIVHETLPPGMVFVEDGVDLAGVVVAMLVMAKLERRRVGDYGLPFASGSWKLYRAGTISGLIFISAVVLSMAALGRYRVAGVLLSPLQIAHYAAIWLVVTFIAAVTEELTFRGYAQVTLANGIGFWPAAILTSGAFAGNHMDNPGRIWLGAASVFVFGLFQCWTLRRTGSLWFAVGLHSAWNFGEAFIYSLPDSGYQIKGHLLRASLKGPNWFTGGRFGPEGGLPAIIVLGFLFLIQFRLTNENYTRQGKRSREPRSTAT